MGAKGVERGHVIANGRGWISRIAVRLADQMQQAAGRQGDQVVADTTGVRPGLPIGRDRAHDEARVDGGQAVVGQTVALHDAGREVLEQHVAVFHQVFDDGLPGRGFDIHAQALLAPVVHDEIARRSAILAVLGHDADVPAVFTFGWEFNLDDFRPRSTISRVACGPASHWVRSRIRTPSRICVCSVISRSLIWTFQPQTHRQWESSRQS